MYIRLTCLALFSSLSANPTQLSSAITSENAPLSNRITKVTQNNFSQMVEQSTRPVIIDAYAPWCPSCRKMSSVFEKLSQKYPDIRFATINVDEEAELAGHYGITRLPTLLFIAPGKPEPMMKSIGALSEEQFDRKIKSFQKELQ